MSILSGPQVGAALISFFVSVCLGSAAEYYVSPSGNDASAGSLASPWRTFAKAASTVVAGDTVYFRGGNYPNAEADITVSATSNAPVTFRNYEGETPILNGSGVSLTSSRGLINITSSSNVIIQGFDIRNYWSNDNDTPAGIWVWGGCENISLLDNRIHDLGSTASPGIRNAHGIAVYGNSNTASSVTISGNELYDLTLGNSEALVINGNVDGFSVTGNTVHDCDNIGIDCIGFEGVGPSSDQARNGLIAGNTVYNIDTRGNPSYGSASAGGIYIDGGKQIVIERNYLRNCNFGIEVASENAGRTTDFITVRNNIVVESHLAGLAIGGFSPNTGGAGGGNAANCDIYNNTFYNNDDPSDNTSYGQIYLQNRVIDCNFFNNICYNSNVEFGANVFITQWNESGSGNLFNHNLFYGFGGDSVFVLEDDWLSTWNQYLSFSGSTLTIGMNEAFQDPGFTNPATEEFSLTAGSVAIDSGDSSFSTSGELDYDGNDRVVNSIVDRGALEFGGSEPEAIPSDLTITLTGDQIQVSWETELAFSYHLETSIDRISWGGVSGFVGKIGTGAVDFYTTVASDPERYFRVNRYGAASPPSIAVQQKMVVESPSSLGWSLTSVPKASNFLKGKTAYQKGDFETAVINLQKALVEADDATVRWLEIAVMLADAYLQLDRNEERLLLLDDIAEYSALR